MTAALSLLLPTQIPWRRLAASNDMMDTTFGDLSYPLKWKTSMSIFYFQPEPDTDSYPDSTITYLKIVCSITGYQVDANELGVDLPSGTDWDTRVWENFNELIRDYYPCYGALLQVAVFPGHEQGQPLAVYPYFIDFEPKKREMYEVVTETGETMSRSATDLRVDKAGTTVDSMESVDIDKGFSVAGEGKSSEGGGGGSVSSSNESGYRAGSQSQTVNVRSIDDSREKRESFSHTTQLTQMYHLLDSYHMGTNRALFAIFPRPHVVDVEQSVANGLRRLEGIQEFFLVVEQPKTTRKLCVEAHLETSHLHKTTRTETKPPPELERGSIKQRINDSYKGGFLHNYTKRQYTIQVPGGMKIDRTQGNGGYTETIDHGDNKTEDIESHSVEVRDDQIVIEVTYDPGPPPDTAFFTADYEVFYVAEGVAPAPETTVIEEVDLYMTGRRVAGCLQASDQNVWSVYAAPERKGPKDWIVHEEPVPPRFFPVVTAGVGRPAGSRTLLNSFGAFLKERTIASVGSPDRYKAGVHTFLHTDFATRALLRAPSGAGLTAPARRTRVALPHDFERIPAKQRKAFAEMTVAELMLARSSMTGKRLNVDAKQILDVKLSNLGFKPRNR